MVFYAMLRYTMLCYAVYNTDGYERLYGKTIIIH